MPTGKLLLAAILGGLAMFIWGAVSHMMLPTYNGALQKFTHEDAVTQAIIANAPTSGTYFLPNVQSVPLEASKEEKKVAEDAVMEKSMKGPSVFAFVRVGEFGSWFPRLGGELAAGILAVLVLGWMRLRMGVTRYSDRVMASVCIGVLVILSMTMLHQNWYDAGWAFVIAEQLIRWLAG